MEHDALPPLTPADRALLLAARVWGEQPDPGLWDLFPPDRCVALRWAWDSGFAGETEAEAREQLLLTHEAQARPDLARVHVSWWVRALKGEPASVRAAVVGHVSAAVSEALRDALGPGPDDLASDRPPHPQALELALALWTERLVGDLADRDDDPPAVVALSQLDATTLTRLIRTTGLAKWSITEEPADLGPDDLARLGRLRERLGAADSRFRHVAASDLAGLGPQVANRAARLGLTTLARLLASVDPYRVRWALQHIPYPTAKALRTLMGPPGRRNPMLARWETDVLRAGWLELFRESRLAEPWRWGIPT